MSAWEAVLLGSIAFGSCFACYCLGQRNMYDRIQRMREKRQRWAEWEDFDE
jgi:hypothetical protein